MHNAIMTYHFKPERLEEAITIWQSGVANHIIKQPGFIRVQFYTEASGTAIAIGSWESQAHADAFMKTGVFANLLEAFGACMAQPPRGGQYDLVYFEEQK